MDCPSPCTRAWQQARWDPGSRLTGRVRLLWRVWMAAWASAWVWNFTKAQPREFEKEEGRVSAHS